LDRSESHAGDKEGAAQSGELGDGRPAYIRGYESGDGPAEVPSGEPFVVVEGGSGNGDRDGLD